MTYRDPPRIPVSDPVMQKAIDELRRSIIELARDVRSHDVTITLLNAVALVVHHGLGRPTINYSVSAPVGPLATGRIEEVSRTSESVTLMATGFGATVSVQVRFW